MRRVEIKVVGQVQGVFFRSEAQKLAAELGLAGWVKNEDNDAVKIIAEGEEEKLKELVEWCRRGTKWSRVEQVDADRHEATGEFADFEIIS